MGRLGHVLWLAHAERVRSAVARREEASGWPWYDIKACGEGCTWVD